MKTLIPSLSLLVSISFVQAQETEGHDLKITVPNAKNDEGTILITLHTAETFMKTDGIMSAEGKIKEGTSEIVLENVKPGEYAIIVLHDQNDNKRMDFEANGMPKESYGTSNNIMSFGPPQYSDAKFKMGDDDMEMTIRF